MKCIFLAIKLRKFNSLRLIITVHPVQKKPSAILLQLPTIFGLAQNLRWKKTTEPIKMLFGMWTRLAYETTYSLAEWPDPHEK